MIPQRFTSLLSERALSPQLASLLEQGFLILRGAAKSTSVAAINDEVSERFERTPFCIGPFHGERTKRFHRLLARSRGARELAVHTSVLGAAKLILGQWCDFPELNLAQGVEIHPEAPEQIPHCDQSMWPLRTGELELCLNVFWPLNSFTACNGATRVWPGTHARPRNPAEPLPAPVICEMEPGDALLILGSTVHAAGANRSKGCRRALIFSYCLGWLKAYENQSLAYPREVAKTMSPELAELIGYRWHRPNLGTFDGQCPSILLQDRVPEHLATIDALSSEHGSIVAQFARSREGATKQPGSNIDAP